MRTNDDINDNDNDDDNVILIDKSYTMSINNIIMTTTVK